MNRILAFLRSGRIIPAVAALALALLAAAACADISPAIGKYYVGRTLHVSVAAMERADELLYSIPAAGGAAPQYYRLTPTEPEQEFLLLRIQVQNHRATSAIVSIDGKAAELRDFFQGKYFPVNVNARAKQTAAPERVDRPGGVRGLLEILKGAFGFGTVDRLRAARCPIQQPNDLCFLWNATFTDGTEQAFDLQKGFGIDGWLIFEAPKDTQIRELRWRAGDSLSIEF